MLRNKIPSLIIGTVLLFLLACGGGGGGSEEKTTPGGGGSAPDTTAPIAGAALSFDGSSDSAITVHWGAATDNATSQASLQYRLVRAATSAEIDTVAEVDAVSGAALVQDYAAGVISKSASGLTGLTTYFFAVVVKDQAGNKALYAPASSTTAAADTVASPSFNPAAGKYGNTPALPNLTMSSATSGAIICYTTNGTTPACNATPACTTGTLYPNPLVVSTTATYKAIACKAGSTDSSVTSGLYTIDTVAPTVSSTSPADAATTVSPSTTIAVTFDEEMDPATVKALTGSTNCSVGSPSVLVSDDNFSNCIAMTSATPATGDNKTFTMTPSSALSYGVTYKIRVTTAVKDTVQNALAATFETGTGFTTDLAPAITISSITPGTGTYTTTQSVNVDTSAGDAVLCYRLDGIAPAATTPGTCDAGSQQTPESSNISISSTSTLKVLATKVAYYNSAVETRVYTLQTKVSSTTPGDAGIGLDPWGGTIKITFNQDVDRSTAAFNAAAGACTGNIQLSKDEFVNCVGLTIPAGNTSNLILTPVGNLDLQTIYKLKVEATLKDIYGNFVNAAVHSTGMKTRYYHTITVDGTNDFTAGETFATSTAGYTTYVTWDKTFLYIGYNGADVGSGAAQKWVTTYIGKVFALSQAGVLYNTYTMTLPPNFFGAYHVQWNANTDISNFLSYTSSWSAPAALTTTGGSHSKNANFVEFKIPFSAIGSPATSVKLLVNMLDATGAGSEATYGMAPATGFTDGVKANPTKYYDCNLLDGNLPTTSCVVTP